MRVPFSRGHENDTRSQVMKKGNNMKRYFVNGKEISEQKAKEIEANNKKYMESNDLSLWAKCEFITVIGK